MLFRPKPPPPQAQCVWLEDTINFFRGPQLSGSLEGPQPLSDQESDSQDTPFSGWTSAWGWYDGLAISTQHGALDVVQSNLCSRALKEPLSS